MNTYYVAILTAYCKCHMKPYHENLEKFLPQWEEKAKLVVKGMEAAEDPKLLSILEEDNYHLQIIPFEAETPDFINKYSNVFLNGILQTYAPLAFFEKRCMAFSVNF